MASPSLNSSRGDNGASSEKSGSLTPQPINSHSGEQRPTNGLESSLSIDAGTGDDQVSLIFSEGGKLTAKIIKDQLAILIGESGSKANGESDSGGDYVR